MSEFPTIVYKSPGLHRATGGKTYDYLGVNDASELSAAMASGWHATLHEALFPTVAADPADTAPATRAELEQKAKELSIGFNARTSDAVLAQRIAEAV
jgi:hypothetical protein